MLVGPDRARRRVEGDRHVRAGIDQRQAAGQRLTAARELILPRRIENDDLHPARQRRQRLHEIRHAHGLKRNIDVPLGISIDRNEVVLTLELQSEAGQIDEGDGVRPGGRELIDKFAKRFAQRRLIEVARAGDGEACGLQGIGDEAGVIGRRRQLRRLVFVVADHQGKPHLGGMTGAAKRRGENDGQCDQHDMSNVAHRSTPWKSRPRAKPDMQPINKPESCRAARRGPRDNTLFVRQGHEAPAPTETSPVVPPPSESDKWCRWRSCSRPLAVSASAVQPWTNGHSPSFSGLNA